MSEEPFAAPLRILIADDNGILRKGIAAVVSEIIPRAVIVEASSFCDAKQQLDHEQFSAAIFDIDMRDLNGPADFQILGCRFDAKPTE